MCDNAAEYHDSPNQGLGTPDSLLPPTEPHDIKNWFSSYEYESFVLETNDNFGFSNYEETQGHEIENRAIPVENSNAFTRSWKNDDTMNTECNETESEPPGIEKWFCSYAYESPPPDTFDNLILSQHKENTIDKQEPRNRKRKEAEKDENLICDQRTECDNASTKNSTENHLHNDLRNHDSAIDSNESSQTSSCTEAANSEANGESGKREEEEGVGNGFVSIRSRNDEKSMRENVKRGSVSVVGEIKKNDGKERSRRILGDMTNIQPGKWKCPRKSKTNIGPPLKQLQLGQWFHRQ